MFPTHRCCTQWQEIGRCHDVIDDLRLLECFVRKISVTMSVTGCHFLLGLADKNGQSFMDAARVLVPTFD